MWKRMALAGWVDGKCGSVALEVPTPGYGVEEDDDELWN